MVRAKNTTSLSFVQHPRSHSAARGDGAEARESMADGDGGTDHTAGPEAVRGAEDTGGFGLESLTSFLSNGAEAVEKASQAPARAA